MHDLLRYYIDLEKCWVHSNNNIEKGTICKLYNIRLKSKHQNLCVYNIVK